MSTQPKKSRSRSKGPANRSNNKTSFDSLSYLSELFGASAKGLKVAHLPIVEHLHGALRSKSFGTAVRLADSLSEQQYGDSEEHFAMNQLASLVRKVPFVDPSLTPEATAWKKFIQAEHRCKRTNQRLRAENSVGRRSYAFLTERAALWIERVIGDEPNLALIYEGCDFGPGASVGIHGNATHLARKLDEKWTATPTGASIAISAMMGDHHIWESLQRRWPVCYDPDLFRRDAGRKVELVAANKITMVPKTAKVHRTIAIEPTLNGYIQKGVDVYMRRCLARYGIDLRDQTRNQNMAREGSLGGLNPLVTIDLSAASDSISIETVRRLIPPKWFEFLNRIRSPSYVSEWGNGRYEKFVTMGNGFCFPLETLIFASLVVAVYAETGDRDFTVYGDDIIVRQSSALYLIEVLMYFGFRTNVDKTFIFGPFRESCGADYFEGVNVRPYILDFIPSTIRDKFKIANGIRDNPFFFNKEAWWTTVNSIPRKGLLLRPLAGPPDTAVTTTTDHFMTGEYVRWNPELQTWDWKEYLSSPVIDDTERHASVYMYGLLRGVRGDNHPTTPLPSFAFRRMTRTSTRWVPGRNS